MDTPFAKQKLHWSIGGTFPLVRCVIFIVKYLFNLNSGWTIIWCRVIGESNSKGCGYWVWTIHSFIHWEVELKYNNILLLQSVVPLLVEFEKKQQFHHFPKPDPIQTKSGFWNLHSILEMTILKSIKNVLKVGANWPSHWEVIFTYCDPWWMEASGWSSPTSFE
jgi:hypothetical protein